MSLFMDIKYFDNAATTSIKPEVLEEMMPYLKVKIRKSVINVFGRKRSKKSNRKKQENKWQI